MHVVTESYCFFWQISKTEVPRIGSKNTWNQGKIGTIFRVQTALLTESGLNVKAKVHRFDIACIDSQRGVAMTNPRLFQQVDEWYRRDNRIGAPNTNCLSEE